MTTTGVGVIGTITGTEVIGDGIAGMVPDGEGDGILGMVRAGMLAGAGAGILGTIGMVRAGAVHIGFGIPHIGCHQMPSVVLLVAG